MTDVAPDAVDKGRTLVESQIARWQAALAAAARAAGPPLLFGLRMWAAVCLALYVAFWLELDNAYWAGTSAALVCQPRLGASLRKGWFRMIGTVVGATAIVLLTAASIAYLVERHTNPEAFGSIPAALWWAIVTMTTTGYGDVVPQPMAGRVLAGVVMMSGILVFALWAGILASGYAEELRRREFLRTWELVAKVPFFHNIGASLIAVRSPTRSSGALTSLYPQDCELCIGSYAAHPIGSSAHPWLTVCRWRLWSASRSRSPYGGKMQGTCATRNTGCVLSCSRPTRTWSRAAAT